MRSSSGRARESPRGYDFRMEALGSDDAVAVGLDDRTALRSLEPSATAPPATGWTSFLERFATAFEDETAAFVALVRDGGESPCPPEAALEALRVAVACERSRLEGRPVAMAEVES
jgi:myo-inositol 2-dehydrogenase/D-chiro-inositol 1-dehydrogenase